MALVRQTVTKHANGAHPVVVNGAMNRGAEAHAAVAGGSMANHLDADVQRRKARTPAQQQQAAERLASAATQLSSGIVESDSAARARWAMMARRRAAAW